MKRYPKSPVVTQFLGSDINELVFAFARIGMFAGRRNNLDCLRLAQALEKRNTYSALSKDDEDIGTAHSRGRRVLNNVTYEEETGALYTVSDILLQDLIQAMKQGIEDCLEDGKKFKLGYLEQSDACKDSSDSADVIEPEVEEILDGVSFGLDMDNLAEDYFGDNLDSAGKVTTPMGTFDRRRVETYYLNKGRSSTPSKARHVRFYYNEYESSKMQMYLGSEMCHVKNCSEDNYFKKGGTARLRKYQRKGSKDKPQKITGTVLFISKGQMCVKSTCRDHSSGLTVWLEDGSGIHRCLS